MHLACRQGGNHEFLETFWMDLPPFIIDASMLFSQTGRMRAIKSDREELNAFCNPADGGSPLDDLAVDPYHWQPFEQDPRPQYLTQPTDRAIYEDWVFLSFPLLTFVKNDTSFSLSGLCIVSQIWYLFLFFTQCPWNPNTLIYKNHIPLSLSSNHDNNKAIRQS